MLLLLLLLLLSLSLLLLLLLYAIHWLILFSVTEFPGQASITDLLENDTIKSLARSSIAYSACSSFTALSGNSDLHLLSTGRRAAVHSESEEAIGKEVKRVTKVKTNLTVTKKMIKNTVSQLTICWRWARDSHFFLYCGYFWLRLYADPVLLGIIVIITRACLGY